MMYEMKASPLKRPHEFLDHEYRDENKLYYCPHCNRFYHAYVNTGIKYPETIDRSKGGIVVRTEYWCSNCNDYAFEVDPMIANSVKLLNENGIRTLSSCSGHVEKFGQCCFESEWCLGGTNENMITYGACISIIKTNDTAKNEIIENVFNQFVSDDSWKEMMLFHEIDEIFIFISPVVDVKEFRKCGSPRREKMLSHANERMDSFVKAFVDKFNTYMK